LRADLRQVELAYQDSGFLKARVEAPEVQFQTAGGGKVAAVRIIIVEGALYSTREIAVAKTQALAPATITQMCPLQKGQPYSRARIAQWRSKIEDAYRSMGYLRAQCRTPETVNEAGKTVDCTMECTEGKPYTVGNITITGDAAVNPAEFKRRLLFSEGGIFNPEMVAMSARFLSQSSLYEPISASDVQLKIDDEKGTVDISLRVVLLKRRQ
jgi:outer membrane protein insertion porin family